MMRISMAGTLEPLDCIFENLHCWNLEPLDCIFFNCPSMKFLYF
jgi:hypothetical protein